MFEHAGVMFLYAETPLHAGSGASLGAVDLPLQREKHTLYPLVQASGIKGAMRELVGEKTGVTEKIKQKKAELKNKKAKIKEIEEELKKKSNDQNLKTEKGKIENEIKEIEKEIKEIAGDIYAVFGPEDGDKFGGCVTFTDAKILLLPVRSLKGVFAWVTSKDVLERFKMHLKSAGITLEPEFNIPEPKKTALVPDSELLLNTKNGNRIVLEEFTFKAEVSEEAKKIAQCLCKNALPAVETKQNQGEQNQSAPDNDAYKYWKDKLMTNLVILPDDYFKYFAEHSTEVVTRIKIGDRGVVEEGPWQEENLPSDSLLYSIIMATDPFKKGKEAQDAKNALGFLRENVNGEVFQLGGNSTVGRGLVRVTIQEKKNG